MLRLPLRPLALLVAGASGGCPVSAQATHAVRVCPCLGRERTANPPARPPAHRRLTVADHTEKNVRESNPMSSCPHAVSVIDTDSLSENFGNVVRCEECRCPMGESFPRVLLNIAS